MTESLKSQIEAIKSECRAFIELAKKATSGPWDDASKYPYLDSVRIFAKTHYIGSIGNSDDAKEQSEANAAFIAHSRSFSPRAAQATLDAIEALERICNFGHKLEASWAEQDLAGIADNWNKQP